MRERTAPIALKHREMENTNKRFFRAFRIVVISGIDIYRVTYHASNICLQKIFLRLFTWAVGKNRVTVRKNRMAAIRKGVNTKRMHNIISFDKLLPLTNDRVGGSYI